MKSELDQVSEKGEPKEPTVFPSRGATCGADGPWSVFERIGFRFLFSYLSLYIILCRLIEDDLGLLQALGLAPGAGIFLWPYARIWSPVVSWTGVHILHLKRHPAFTSVGNSDGVFGYVQIFTFALLAAIATLIWTVADRKSAQYRRLHDGLRIALRYAVAASMLSYGMIKVIPVQFFGLPNLIDMASPFGNLRSFSLLWDFMGYSKAYTVFAGGAEVVAGLLLFSRRTTTLGALLSAAALTNVGVLDFAYDVPEKLDVIHLVVMSAVLLMPDLGRLARLFVFNQGTVPAQLEAPMSAKWMRIGGLSAKAAVILLICLISALTPFKITKLYDPPSPLHGIYEVEEFARNGEALPPLTTDKVRWKKIVFESQPESWVEMMDESWHFYATEFDLQSKTVTLVDADHKSRNTLAYSQPDSGSLMLRGTSAANSYAIKLKKFDESTFPLMRSHFRWVNGFP
jgi:hypothetical protein